MGEAVRLGVRRAAADRPATLFLAPPLGWGARAGSREWGGVTSRSVGGDILPLGRLAASVQSLFVTLSDYCVTVVHYSDPGNVFSVFRTH